MSRFGHLDILMELVDLCHEVIDDVRQQLSYYRVSVYKTDAAKELRSRLEQLESVSKLIDDEPLLECFDDYRAIEANGNLLVSPGECTFANRVVSLIAGVELQLHYVKDRALKVSETTIPGELASHVRQHRSELLGLCRQGSRKWSFFQAV